ncbi:MAG: lipopolysaccharide/colanic/teichoic acid biosynthesis glycosyltransferase [Sulfitobacter sp.]|jgi:lipopolysaccharide/colanic/teichoic acid biosynthesis glycosyltransferase
MKKFNVDGPNFGLFDMTAPQRNPAQRAAPVAPHSYVWDAAIARKSAPFYMYRDFGKRLVDLLFVLLTLPFSLPLIGICALALWVEGGSPFYTQDRLGRKGAGFSILKLRTMVRNADAVLETYLASDPEMRREWDELQKLRNDPRVTRVGRFLRATSLDELPQLFNVLQGDMSIVGPRPMLPGQLAMYGNAKAYEALRPGITGLWQISLRNNNGFSYRNQIDATYERDLTLKLDLAVLFKTIGVVLRGTGC